jgi:lanosterol synthase
MRFLYGHRFKAKENDLILTLCEVRSSSSPTTRRSSHLMRILQELYIQNYYSIDWPAQRNNVSEADLYAPHTRLLDFLNTILSGYDSCSVPPIRRAALAHIFELIILQDENTEYQILGPKMMNLVCRVYIEGPDSEAYKQHEIKRRDIRWLGKDGMTMCGTNSSQLWDTAHYESSYRHCTKGAWGFSTKEQGYTVSDCTGEGLKAVPPRTSSVGLSRR